MTGFEGEIASSEESMIHECTCGYRCLVGFERVSIGDCVLADVGQGVHIAADVLSHFSVTTRGGTRLLTLVRVFDFARRARSMCSEHRIGDAMWLRLEQIICATVWSPGPPIRVLTPSYIAPNFV